MVCKCNCVPPDCLPMFNGERRISKWASSNTWSSHIWNGLEVRNAPTLPFFIFLWIPNFDTTQRQTRGYSWPHCRLQQRFASSDPAQWNHSADSCATAPPPFPTCHRMSQDVTGCHRMSQAPLRDILSKILQRSYEMLNPGLASNLAALPGRGRNAANREDGWILMQDIELKSWDTEFRQVSTLVISCHDVDGKKSKMVAIIVMMVNNS